MCISFWQMSMQPWFQCYCKWAPNFVRTSNTTGRVIGAFDLAIVLLIWKCATAALGLNWHCTQGANYHKVGVFIGFSIPVNSAYSLVERVCRWEFFCCYILLVCYWNVLVAYLLIRTWHDSSFICFIWPRSDTKILCLIESSVFTIFEISSPHSSTQGFHCGVYYLISVILRVLSIASEL